MDLGSSAGTKTKRRKRWCDVLVVCRMTFGSGKKSLEVDSSKTDRRTSSALIPSDQTESDRSGAKVEDENGSLATVVVHI